MSAPNEYKPYWFYFAWTVAIVSFEAVLFGAVYALSVIAPTVLAWVGIVAAGIAFCALYALMPWLGQDE